MQNSELAMLINAIMEEPAELELPIEVAYLSNLVSDDALQELAAANLCVSVGDAEGSSRALSLNRSLLRLDAMHLLGTPTLATQREPDMHILSQPKLFHLQKNVPTPHFFT